ncbi:alpha/beta hydrolase family protein [Streptomyces yaizuensis]|uniref:Alpha/beta hydrolase n=1 Tax=Streptomyces yaizuensis TaxID=2989713 RepID=A0ABQ5NSK9_9ACTN|nr:alpha/beta hydrolase [Streptomyces sp. YSPA8]GLF93349.1 alpha/beta hydrolase [Streptomyces sp. YSPA8]
MTAERARLPRPTGGHPVGSDIRHLVDRSRSDPWKPAADGRELMLTLHYPARAPGHGPTAPYATTEEAAALARGLDIAAAVPADRLGAMRTHSRPGARPAPGPHPLVVLSPGFSVSRFTLTHLAEELASRGYVVASLDHAYESFGIAVPGGRLLDCAACPPVFNGTVHPGVVTATRSGDVSFALDRLLGPRPVWRHAAVIDRKRIGMAGHSIGGASALSAMAGDVRVRAGVNMDGAFWDELPPEGLRGRPFMLLGTDDDVHRPGGRDTSWDRTWPRLDGWKRWLTVAGSTHMTFSDHPVIAGQFGLPGDPLPDERAVLLTRRYVTAFFDRHLRGRPQPLLAGPSASHPEVVFHHH